MEHAWGRLQMYTIRWLENLNPRDYSEELGIGSKIIIEWILEWEGVE